jgi:YidC/Oxa1 family membrane protein insertase
MNNLRVFLWLALVMVLYVNFDTWQRDDAAQASEAAATQAATDTSAIDDAAPTAAANPSASPVADAPANATAATASVEAGATPAEGPAPRLTVRTDVLDLTISLRGGELDRADILQYPKVKNEPGVPVQLLRDNGKGDTYVVQTGLAPDAGGGDRPTHQALFSAEFREFRLLDGADTLKVPMVWTSPDGVTVTKTYVFRRGEYNVDVEYAVRNDSAAVWPYASYVRIVQDLPPVETSYFHPDTYSFQGPAMWDGNKYTKLKLDDEDAQKLDQPVTDGWLAALQYHFVSAHVPPKEQTYRYSLKVRDTGYQATSMGPTLSVAAGSTAQFKETLFVGPKLQKDLMELHPELYRAADYGTLTLIARPLFVVLSWIHDVVGNWGWTIMIVTLLLKLLMYPLSEASGKSMARMRTLGPRIQALQETYKDDREKLGKAMMDLYKRESINPAAGCLPMLIQMPVFLAFYWVLLESVEMRQAPFMLWIQDLSSRDPYFILPIIMAGAMFLQYKLNPKPTDEMQAKVFMILPLVMSVTFAFFPAGLVLYWVTNTVLSIAQQWNINRRIEAAAK